MRCQEISMGPYIPTIQCRLKYSLKCIFTPTFRPSTSSWFLQRRSELETSWTRPPGVHYRQVLPKRVQPAESATNFQSTSSAKVLSTSRSYIVCRLILQSVDFTRTSSSNQGRTLDCFGESKRLRACTDEENQRYSGNIKTISESVEQAKFKQPKSTHNNFPETTHSNMGQYYWNLEQKRTQKSVTGHKSENT